MATPDGLWAILTIFEIGQLRDALRQAAFTLHHEETEIEISFGQSIPAAEQAVPNRVLVVIADHGRFLEPPPEEVRRAS